MITERRTKTRYPLELTVQYQTLGDSQPICGEGQTLNVSSSGMLITAGHNLKEGSLVKVTIEWPTLLNGKTALQLVTTGKVVRRQESSWGVAFDHYQFRTRKQKPAIALSSAVAAAMTAPAMPTIHTAASSFGTRAALKTTSPGVSLRNVG
jgi:PilZ domain-containing protein